MWIGSVSSLIPLQLLPVAIVYISRSIRLKAANVHQSESGTPDQSAGSLSLSRSKQIRMILGSTWLSASSWSLQAQCHSHLPSSEPGKTIMCALLILELKHYWTRIAMVALISMQQDIYDYVLLVSFVATCYIKSIQKSRCPLQERPCHRNWRHGCVSIDWESLSNKRSPKNHHDKYCIYNEMCMLTYPTVCWMTLILYHQGHCGTPWPVTNNVHLERKITKIFLFIVTLMQYWARVLAINSDLDLSAPRSSLHLIVLLLRHMCGL